MTYREAVRLFREQYVMDAVKRCKGNQCQAAKELGMHRNSVLRIVEGSRGDLEALLSERALLLKRLRKLRQRNRYREMCERKRVEEDAKIGAILREHHEETQARLNDVINEREGFAYGSTRIDRMMSLASKKSPARRMP